MHAAIVEQRLLNQCIAREGPRRTADVVAWFGAVQAQEYGPAKWGLGLRMQDGAIERKIDRAFEHGLILRTHVMRPTWHFVSAPDIRWLVQLTAPRVHLAMSSYRRRLGLDVATLVRGTAVFERALRDRQYLTRPELGERLQRARVATDSVRLAHLAMFAELEGVICSGPRRGKQFTYALLAERAPGALLLPRDEALAELTLRYFRSHGPATIRDFVWWSGLTTADARRGLDMNRAHSADVGGRTYWTVRSASRGAARDGAVRLLPIYDEYLVAYRDRDAVPHGPSVIASASKGPVTFQHALVVDGQVAGTWRTTARARALHVDVFLSRRLSTPARRALADAAARYGRFLSTPVSLSIVLPAV